MKKKVSKIPPEKITELKQKAINSYLSEHTYPKYGNVLIMAGGAGSGKGFALENEIAFEGKHFDVDFLKSQMRKFQINSPIDKEFFQLYGKHISQTDMKNENDVSNLHEFCSKKGFDKQTIRQFIQHASNRAIKDNMIFDVTLQNIRKLIEIVSYCDMCGYNRENIHIVWVLNDFSVAQQQNANRSRTVNNDILTSTHVGVSKTIHSILTNAEGLMDNTDGSPIIDGDMWILFNKKNVDNFTQTSSKGEIRDLREVYYLIKKSGCRYRLSLEETTSGFSRLFSKASLLLRTC